MWAGPPQEGPETSKEGPGGACGGPGDPAWDLDPRKGRGAQSDSKKLPRVGPSGIWVTFKISRSTPIIPRGCARVWAGPPREGPETSKEGPGGACGGPGDPRVGFRPEEGPGGPAR